MEEPEFEERHNPGGSPQVIGKLYASTGFGSILWRLIPLDWPIEMVSVPNPLEPPEYGQHHDEGQEFPTLTARMQVRTFERDTTRQFGVVTAEFWARTFPGIKAQGINRIDMTIPVLFVWYKEVL